MKTSLLLVGLALCSVLPASAQKSNNHNFEISRNLEIFSDIYKQLDMFYVDSIAPDTVIKWGVDAMLRRLDPFTEYFSGDDTKNLRTLITGKYAGIGSYIRYHGKERRTVISEPYEGSPAHEAGLRAGDVLLTVDGTDVLDMPTDKVSEMLRGEPGTTLRLTVRRPGEKEEMAVSIVRRNIQMPQVSYYGQIQPGVGYIYLTGFTEGAAREVRHAVEALMAEGINSLVLDLRGNPGGSLNEAVEIAALFVEKGSKVVYTKGKIAAANRTYYTTGEPLSLNLPVLVMVDGGTASSAEIVSGTLQDYDRAVVVGQRTYGKGLVQIVRDTPYHGNLKITISRYYIPSGRCIQAYDYRHLNADGSVGTVPDSLTQVFHTRAGREVRDGGGIKPDVVLEIDTLPSMVFDLVSSEAFFDFATRYAFEHKTIAPAGDFDLADEEYDAFVAFVQEGDFSYNRRSVEMLKMLKSMAEHEGYYADAAPEFEALSAKFKTDLGRDLRRFKTEIKKYLCEEIVRRYYYQRGGVLQQLRGDTELERALKILSAPAHYNQILSTPDKHEAQ